jgi:hypothetical protein
MKKVKLLCIQLAPLIGIFNEEEEMIGEERAPEFKIYPGNDLTDIVRQMKEQLEVEIP